MFVVLLLKPEAWLFSCIAQLNVTRHWGHTSYSNSIPPRRRPSCGCLYNHRSTIRSKVVCVCVCAVFFFLLPEPKLTRASCCRKQVPWMASFTSWDVTQPKRRPCMQFQAVLSSSLQVHETRDCSWHLQWQPGPHRRGTVMRSDGDFFAITS